MKVNHPDPMQEISGRNQLNKAKDRHPGQRGIEARRYGPRPKVQILNPITTSRDGTVT